MRLKTEACTPLPSPLPAFLPSFIPRATRVMTLDVLSETAANSAAVVLQDARYQHAPFVQPPGAPGRHWEKKHV